LRRGSATPGKALSHMRIRSYVFIPLLLIAGCASLPDDGPTPHGVTKVAARPGARYSLVELTYAATQEINANAPAALAQLVSQTSSAPNDLIEPGDQVQVSVFEAGEGGLFGRSIGAATFGAASLSPQAAQQSLPALVVDREGYLAIPYAGAVNVAGLTPTQAGERVRRALLGKAIDPQVSLVVANSRANTVGIIGAVRNPGHYPLSPSNDRLLDIIESAGGPTQQPGDIMVVVDRHGRTASASLAEVLAQPADDIRLAPKDEVRLLETPRKYETFGALGRPSEIAIVDPTLTLAGALARSGGLDTNSANPRWVMVFRFERPSIARALGASALPTTRGVPIIYRLNVQDPQGYFIAGNFEVKSNDVIFVARSDISEARKFLDFVNSITTIYYSVSSEAATFH
jgi:polysaccharide biosynthesis/export protein